MKKFIIIFVVSGCTSTDPVRLEQKTAVSLPDPVTQYNPVSPAKATSYPAQAIHRDPEPIKSNTDCSGLVSGPDPLSPQKVANGRFGVGQMLGQDFMPVLYFSTKDAAKRCSEGLEVRKWNGDKWTKI